MSDERARMLSEREQTVCGWVEKIGGGVAVSEIAYKMKLLPAEVRETIAVLIKKGHLRVHSVQCGPPSEAEVSV